MAGSRPRRARQALSDDPQRWHRRPSLLVGAVGAVTAALAVTPQLLAAAAKSPQSARQVKPAAPAPQEPLPTVAPRWAPTYLPETGYTPLVDEPDGTDGYQLLLGLNGSKEGPVIQVITTLDPQGRLGANRPGASSVTVRGHAAALVPIVNGTRISWVERPGLVLTVAVYGGLSDDVLLRVAESVVQS